MDQAIAAQVVHLQPPHRDREPLELSPQAQSLQDPARARGDLQPGADLGQRRRLLVDLDVDPFVSQRQRRGHAADAAADHDCLHEPLLLVNNERLLRYIMSARYARIGT